MTPEILLHVVIRPTLALLQAEAGIQVDRRAERMLIAIALQESGLRHRVQMGGGPAHGLWQFEKGGGVAGVLSHPATRARAARLCALLLTPAGTVEVHTAISDNDLLACGFARLLLWSDPRPLPDTQIAGWACYLRNWRPGKPHERTWAGHWATAEGVTA